MQEYIEEINTCEIGLQLLEKIRNIHKDQRLCGEPGNVLLDAHDDLLLYILALLRGDAHFLPEFHPPGEIRDQMRTAFLMSRIRWKKHYSDQCYEYASHGYYVGPIV